MSTGPELRIEGHSKPILVPEGCAGDGFFGVFGGIARLEMCLYHIPS